MRNEHMRRIRQVADRREIFSRVVAHTGMQAGINGEAVGPGCAPGCRNLSKQAFDMLSRKALCAFGIAPFNCIDQSQMLVERLSRPVEALDGARLDHSAVTE